MTAWPPPDAGPPPRRPGHTRQRIAAETTAMRAGWLWSPTLRAWVHPDRPGDARPTPPRDERNHP